MTVAELINLLKDQDPNAKVAFVDLCDGERSKVFNVEYNRASQFVELY